MTQQLLCKDLRAGDVMVKLNDGSLTNELIKTGQSLFKQIHPSITHAGIMFDSNIIIEAQGKGIVANDLRVGNARYSYYVFRCTDPNMAQGAGTCGKLMFDIHAANDNLKYGLFDAIKSVFGSKGKPLSRTDMDNLLTRILDGSNQKFFCSQFVVYVYQFVAENMGIAASQVFNTNDAKVTPSALGVSLAGNRMFSELGYMMGGER